MTRATVSRVLPAFFVALQHKVVSCNGEHGNVLTMVHMGRFLYSQHKCLVTEISFRTKTVWASTLLSCKFHPLLFGSCQVRIE